MGPVPAPTEIVGRSRRVAAVLVVFAVATLVLAWVRARDEAGMLRRDLTAAREAREAISGELVGIRDRLDDALLELRRAGEDNDRLQREVAELALAPSEEDRREIIRRFNEEQRRVDAARRAEDTRRAERRRERPSRSPSPSRTRSPPPSPTPRPSASRSPSPTPLLTCVPAPLPSLCV